VTPILGLLLLPKLLILVTVFFVLTLLVRGMGIYEKLAIYTLIMLAVIFGLRQS
jgi:hypothetical protein